MLPNIALAGEVAVVTGVCGRLGQVWARTLLESGCDVAGVDLDDVGRCFKDASLAPGSGRYVGIQADVTSRASLEEALLSIRSAFGPPSILVNNAGIDQPPSLRASSWLFEDVPDLMSANVLDVNALGVLRVCQVLGSAMLSQRRGSIVNIGSLYGSVVPDPHFYDHLGLNPPFLKPPAYGMSKAAVVALTRYLATLWAPYGIRVNALSPGGVLGDQDERFKEKFVARVPLGRMASPDDLTGPLLFLASDLSRYVTGTELVVDGGYLCW